MASEAFAPEGPPHFPGRNTRPGDALFAAARAAADRGFAAGVSAFRQRYYWEAHELWEPVWMAHPPASAERHLVQGLIQLANAGLKGRMGQPRAAGRILALADAALAEAFLGRRSEVCGVTLMQSLTLRDQAAGETG